MANRGVYLLWLYLPAHTSITIGKLGRFNFTKGVYAYAGSAQRNLEQRLARHERLDKKLHWHIDYFRACADFLGAARFLNQPKEGECRLIQELLQIPGAQFPVPGLGSSDCRCCSHLVYLPLVEPRG